MIKDFRLKAFTLAEVLITLGIIGVVAAMTMPVLIQKHREQVAVTKVKKFYSTFSQAYLMAVQENGTLDNWGLKDSEQEEDDDGNKIHSDESLEQYDKFLTIMSKYLKKVEQKKMHNTVGEKGTDNIGYVMADGTRIVGVWLKPSTCNGLNPKAYCGDFYMVTDNKSYYENDRKTFRPNIFAFQLRPYSIFPSGASDSSFKNNCLSGKNRSHCTGWVITNGNMDYLHCDDLEWNGKTKCK